MSYIDKNYILNSIDLSKLNALTGNNDSRLAEKIKASDSMIDSYLRSKIKTLPIDPVPDSIKQVSFDLTIFNLHDRVQYSDIPQWVKDKYDAAIDYLTKIAQGKVTLIPEPPEDDVESSVEVGGYDTVMTRKFP